VEICVIRFVFLWFPFSGSRFDVRMGVFVGVLPGRGKSFQRLAGPDRFDLARVFRFQPAVCFARRQNSEVA